MDIDRIVVRLFADATPYTTALRRAEHQLLGFGNRAGGIGRLLDTPIRLATVSTIALTAAMGAAAYQAFKLAANFEVIGVSLEVMTGSAAEGKKLLEDINQLAVETPFRSTGLQRGAKELAAFGVETYQLIDTLKVLGDVASGVANDNLDEMMGRIILAFGQVKTAGRLMGPEMRQFVQAGVPMNKYLSEAMGVDQSMIKLLIEEGKVSFGDTVRAFNLMTREGGRFFNLMERQSQTVMGRWNAFMETVELFLRDIGLAAFEGLGMRDFLESLRATAAELRSGDGARMKQFFSDIRTAIENINKFFKLVNYWIVSARDGTKGWLANNEKLVTDIQRVALAFVAILGTILLVKAALIVIGLTVAALTNPLVQIGIALAVIAAFDEDFGKGLLQGLDQVAKALSVAGRGLKDAILAEDWELVGRIISTTLELGFTSMIAAVKFELLALIGVIASRFGIEVERISRYAVELARRFGDIFNEDFAKKPEEEKRKIWSDRWGAINNEINEKHKQRVVEFEIVKQLEIEKAIAPVRDRLEKMRGEAFRARIGKEADEFRRNNPFTAMMQDVEKEMSGMMWRDMENMVTHFNRIFGHRSKWTKDQERQFGEAAQWTEAAWKARHEAVKATMFGLEVFKQLQSGVGEGVALGAGISPPLEISPQARAIAADIRREMGKQQDKGIGFGAGQFSAFVRTMGFLDEARFGPVHKAPGLGLLPLGGVLGAGIPKGIIDEEQYRFERYREFQNLRRFVGDSSDRLPPTAMMGTAEAQDIINRSRMQQADKLQEMIQILKAAQQIEESQKIELEKHTEFFNEAARQLGLEGFTPRK